jgi:hypothetical protein
MLVSGVCDSATLNRLWTHAVSHSLNPDQILVESGLGVLEAPSAPPVFVERVDDNPGRELLRARLNEMLGDVPDVRFGQLAVEHRLWETVGVVATRCATLNERLNTIEQRTAKGRRLMAVIVDSTARCNDLLGEALRALDNVVRSHTSAQGKFEEIKVHVGFMRRTNYLMAIFGFIAIIAFCCKSFHLPPFNG